MGPVGKRENWDPSFYAGRSVLVFGLARSGVAAVELLHSSKARVTIVDEGSPVVAEGWLVAMGAQFSSRADVSLLQDIDLFVLSPGIPPSNPLVIAARRRGIEVISEIELAFRCSSSPVLAITGSKGKSTTAALIGHFMNALGVSNVVAGNIGLPYARVVPQLDSSTWVVLELSSFQLETVSKFRAGAAIALHLSEDHLDRYADMNAYAAAKANIVRNQRNEDLLVVDPEHSYSQRLMERTPARVVGYGHLFQDQGVRLEDDRFVWHGEGPPVELATVQDVSLIGRHNHWNVMAALAVCQALGHGSPKYRQALQRFDGLEFRMQSLGTIDGLLFVNDAKSTTVEAVRGALTGAEGPIILAMGGRNKGLDFAALRASLAAVRQVFVFGEEAPRIQRDLEDCVPVQQVQNLEELVRKALQLRQIGDTLLFSPGCTSFDMFGNAEERGQAFAAAVEEARRERG